MPFSNGTAYDLFRYNVCERCIHHELDKTSDTYGCPLMDAFLLWSYGAKEDHKDMIDFLCDGKTCKMFKPIGALGQKRLTDTVKSSQIGIDIQDG